MFEPERITIVDGKKYLLQNPYYNNCAVVGIFNAILDFDQNIDMEKLFKLEKKYNKIYNIDDIGLQPTIMGHIAWEFGYYTNLLLSPNIHDVFDGILNGFKYIRIYGWKKNTFPIIDIDLIDSYTKYTKQFKDNYGNVYKNKERKIVTRPQIIEGTQVEIGAHAFFVNDIKADHKCSGINFTIGVNIKDVLWSYIGLHPDLQSKGIALGTELCIGIKKKEKYEHQ